MSNNARTRASNKYNKANYTQIKIEVPKELAENFKAKCETDGKSVRSVLLNYMEGYSMERITVTLNGLTRHMFTGSIGVDGKPLPPKATKEYQFRDKKVMNGCLLYIDEADVQALDLHDGDTVECDRINSKTLKLRNIVKL